MAKLGSPEWARGRLS